MTSWFPALERRVLFDEPKTALAGEVANYLRQCPGTVSILYVGEIEHLTVSAAGVPVFRMPMSSLEETESAQVLDPEAELAKKSDKLLIYAPIALFSQWMSMADDIERLLNGRRQVTIVMILPGLVMERVMDFRWMLSALLECFANRRYEVVMTFFPSNVAWDIRRSIIRFFSRPFWLGRFKGLVRWTLETARSAISYDLGAGVRGDPYQFAAVLMSIRPKAATSD